LQGVVPVGVAALDETLDPAHEDAPREEVESEDGESERAQAGCLYRDRMLEECALPLHGASR